MENENTATAVGIAVSSTRPNPYQFDIKLNESFFYWFFIGILCIVIGLNLYPLGSPDSNGIIIFGTILLGFLGIAFIFFLTKTDYKYIYNFVCVILLLFYIGMFIGSVSSKDIIMKILFCGFFTIIALIYFFYYIKYFNDIDTNFHELQPDSDKYYERFMYFLIFNVFFPINLIYIYYNLSTERKAVISLFAAIVELLIFLLLFFLKKIEHNYIIYALFIFLGFITLLPLLPLLYYLFGFNFMNMIQIFTNTYFLFFLLAIVIMITIISYFYAFENVYLLFVAFCIIIFLSILFINKDRILKIFDTILPHVMFIAFILFTAIFYFYLIITARPNDKKIYNLNFAFGSIFMMIILFYFLYLSSKSKGGLFQEFTKTIFTGFSSFSQCFEYIKKIDTEKLNSMPIYAVIAILLFLGVCIYYVSIDSTFLTNNTFSIAIFISAILLFGFFITTTESNTALIIGGVFLMIVAMIYFVHNNTTINNYSLNYIFYIMIFLMIVVGMAMFYGLLKNYLVRQIGLLGFIMNLIFFIPCMLYDLIDYFKNEYKITSSNMLILFIVELVLVISYLYLPKLVSFTTAENSNLLLGEPKFLKHPITISNSKIFRISESDTEDPELFRNNNYSFSFWVFINTSNKELKNILRYSDSDSKGGKPQIMYGNDDKYTDKYVVYFSNNVPTGESESVNSIEMTLNNQKWNFWTINYLDNVCEIYINGYLEKVVSLNNIPKEGSQSDEVKIGDNDGLDGAICNVKYYNKPLSSFEIISMYKKDQMDIITVGFPYSSFSFKQTLSTLGVRT